MVLEQPSRELLLPKIQICSFIFFRQEINLGYKSQSDRTSPEPGLEFFFDQQRKTADELVTSIRKAGGKAESWEGDLGNPKNVHLLFEEAEKTFGQVDILAS